MADFSDERFRNAVWNNFVKLVAASKEFDGIPEDENCAPDLIMIAGIYSAFVAETFGNNDAKKVRKEIAKAAETFAPVIREHFAKMGQETEH